MRGQQKARQRSVNLGCSEQTRASESALWHRDAALGSGTRRPRARDTASFLLRRHSMNRVSSKTHFILLQLPWQNQVEKIRSLRDKQAQHKELTVNLLNHQAPKVTPH